MDIHQKRLKSTEKMMKNETGLITSRWREDAQLTFLCGSYIHELTVAPLKALWF
jgi:hypothetical protein